MRFDERIMKWVAGFGREAVIFWNGGQRKGQTTA